MESPAETNGKATIESTAHIPIAQLTPLFAAPASRSIKAIVTLTWPYSSATGSVAFLLSEPDFRLRRTRGQVRVQFAGSSAKQVAKSGIASGDEVILCLDGVEWIQDENKVATPGKGVEFELKFSERLLLQFRQEDSQETQLVDIDHPTPEPEAAPETIIPPEPSTAPSPVTNGHTASIPTNAEQKDNEYSSPAFLKRARTSYGSVFEGFDPFDEADGTVHGKGRKRTRLSDVKRWQYSSRSPTPEREESAEATPAPSPEPVVQPRPTMTDEGCQTMDLEADDAAEALADFSRQAVNVGGTSYARLDEPIDPGIQAQVPVAFGNIMPPPVIQTSFPLAEVQPNFEQVAPLSSRLRPQPSESLPLISPLVSKSLFGFSEPSTPALLPGQNGISNQEPPAPIESSVPPSAALDDEDIYSASPKRRVEAAPVDFSGFTNPFVDANGFIPVGEEEHFGFEDQYGQWQRDNANLSHTSSPRKHPDNQEHLDETVEDERFYVEEGQDVRQFLDDDAPHDQEPIRSQYPDLDELSGHHPVPVWGGQSAVAYPDLPEPENEMEDNSMMSAPPPRSTAMSRADSQQSQAIDLTESSDEEEDQEGEEAALGDASDVEESEGSIVSEEQEQQAGHIRSQYFLQGDTRVPQEDYEGEESYDEEEFEVDENGDYIYPPGVHEDRGDYYEDEESEGESEGYDEDPEEDEPPPRPRVQQAPIVIDLLSSDDEDAGAMPTPKPPIPTPQQAAPEPDSDEAMQDDQATRHAEGLKLRQEEQERQGSYESSEESDSEDETKDRQDTLQVREDLESDDEEGSQDLESESNAALGEDKENVILQLDEEPATIDDDISDENSSKLQRRQSSSAPIPPILYPRMFGMDGTHDEDVAEDPSKPGSEKGQESVEPETQRDENSGQLPTPDDTQKSEKIFSAEASFATTQETHTTALESQNTSIGTSSEILNTDAREEVKVEIIETSTEIDQTEPASITEDTAKMTVEDTATGDLELKVEEATIEDVVVETTTHEAMEDTLMEGIADNETASEDFTEKATDTHEIVQEVLEPHQFVEEPALVSPRRSSRLVKSTILEPKENVRPSTPVKATMGNQQSSARSDRAIPIVAIDEQRSSPQGHDASVELALASHDSPVKKHNLRRPSVASIDSPNKQHNLRNGPTTEAVPHPKPHNLRKPANENEPPPKHDLRKHSASETDTPTKGHDLRKAPVADLKLKLSRALRTELSEFTALKVLRYHLNSKLDVLAVATTTSSEPQRGKGTSRQFLTTFSITDVSIAPSAVTEIQVFRPYKDALPIIHAGDGVLLRNFQVISVKNKGFALRSDDASSWAVFKDEEEPEIRGPPVEFAAGEKKHIELLKKWYGDLDATMMAKLNRANADKANAA